MWLTRVPSAVQAKFPGLGANGGRFLVDQGMTTRWRVALLLALVVSAAVGCGGSGSGSNGPVAVGPAPAAGGASASRAAAENPGGMWMPEQMPAHSSELAELGLSIDAAGLSDPTRAPLSAVVSLGGCTASFVSPEGLILTNHHCVQSALQLNSTAEENLVENGFLAKSRADERYAGPTQRVRVVQKMSDVSEAMVGGLAAIADPKARKVELDRRQKALIAGCEKGRHALRCEVREFFGGALWQLVELMEIRDVRLVYVPHRAIGNYGGEIDNWAWPRHTGDFAFYRAYVGPDGKSAEHSPSNVPYRPASFLKVQVGGVAAGDLVFVTGFPSKTNRHLTSAEMRHAAEWTHPRYVDKATRRMAVLAGLQSAGGETAIKAVVTRQRTQNGLEKYQGILDGIRDHNLVQAKQAAEESLRSWAGRDPARKRYVEALDALDARLAALWKEEAERELWEEAVRGSTLLEQALLLVKWSHEQQKKDAERDLGYQDRDRTVVTGGQKTFAKRFDPGIDRALWKLTLVRAAGEPSAKAGVVELLGLPAGGAVDEAAIDKALDRMYSATKLADVKVRMDLLSAAPGELARSRDPFMQAALRVFEKVEALEDRKDAWFGELLPLRSTYMQGLMAHAGGSLAPDANGTLRISFGTVRGYRPGPQAAEHVPFTTASELPRKNTGVKPFDAPRSLLDAIAAGKWGAYEGAGLGSVPIAFLSDLDITGGNSGSPVLNARGEVVGVAFDGNYEGLASDVLFRGQTTRMITADIRYILWVADAVDQADHVVEELGVKPSL
jgi:hypothetical protein